MSSSVEARLLAIPVPPGAALESQSGLQMNWPRVFGALSEGGGPRRTAAILIHPTSNFMGHYMIAPLVARGVDVLALNTRYVNNDSTLIMERVILDLGAGVTELRQRGYDRVFLIGNSGGAALVSLYQAQAERITITHTPAGDPIELSPDQLPSCDGIVLAAAHAGRAELLRGMIDASVIDEQDAAAADPELDMYAASRPPPFSAEFVRAIREGQDARVRRITERARARLAWLRTTRIANDEAFLVHRTYADPRFIDLSLDKNDRKPGGNRGSDARAVNYGPNCLGRFCTLTSWLSQWSERSVAKGPDNLAKTTVPILQIEYTADGSVFPSTLARWADAARGRLSSYRLQGGNHYLKGQPALVEEACDAMAAWMRERS